MNITFNIFLLFFSLGAIQGFILSVLILVKRQQKLYNYYFGIFLLLLSLGSAKIILQETIPQFLDNFHFPLLYKFAFGPLLYLFVRELLFKSAGSFSAIFPHFVPSLIFDVFFRVSLPLFGFKNSDAAIQIFNFFGLNIGSLLYNLVYCDQDSAIIFKNKRPLFWNYYTNENNPAEANWKSLLFRYLEDELVEVILGDVAYTNRYPGKYRKKAFSLLEHLKEANEN